MRLMATFLLFALPGAALAYDANGAALGASEAEVMKRFPSARCQALEWKSKAADRRCDDAKMAFAGGVPGRITSTSAATRCRPSMSASTRARPSGSAAF